MDHIAILSHSSGMLENILEGLKTIESRWSVRRQAPYSRVHPNHTIYFKDSHEHDIYTKATAEKIIELKQLTQKTMKYIISEYGKQLCMDKNDLPSLKGKNYCTLIFLKDVKKIKPFQFDKTGYGCSTAWLCVGDINNVKI